MYLCNLDQSAHEHSLIKHVTSSWISAHLHSLIIAFSVHLAFIDHKLFTEETLVAIAYQTEAHANLYFHLLENPKDWFSCDMICIIRIVYHVNKPV